MPTGPEKATTQGKIIPPVAAAAAAEEENVKQDEEAILIRTYFRLQNNIPRNQLTNMLKLEIPFDTYRVSVGGS